IVVPRFSGSDHSENRDAADATNVLVRARSGSAAHPRSSPMEVTQAIICDCVVIQPPRLLSGTGPAGGHPEVLLAETTRADRREDQRTTVAREHRLRIEVRSVDRRVQMGWIRPGVLGGLAGEAPEVRGAATPRPPRGHPPPRAARAPPPLLCVRGRGAPSPAQ